MGIYFSKCPFFTYSNKMKNPNPSPTGKRFGFCAYDADKYIIIVSVANGPTFYKEYLFGRIYSSSHSCSCDFSALFQYAKSQEIHPSLYQSRLQNRFSAHSYPVFQFRWFSRYISQCPPLWSGNLHPAYFQSGHRKPAVTASMS